MAESYKMLTPAFRRQILESLDRRLRDLDACQENALVAVQRLGIYSYKALFQALPDGYPVPIITKGGRYDE